MMHLQRRSLRGAYRDVRYPLPSDSLTVAAIPAVVSAVKASAKAGMAGAYGPPAQRWPGAYSRRPGMAGMGTAAPTTPTPAWLEWITNNPGLAAAAAVGAVLLLGKGGRGR